MLISSDPVDISSATHQGPVWEEETVTGTYTQVRMHECAGVCGNTRAQTHRRARAHTQAPWTCQAGGFPFSSTHSLVQNQDLAGVTPLEAECFPRAGPKASWEEVTSFGKPLTALPALPRPLSASFLPEPGVADPPLNRNFRISPRLRNHHWEPRKKVRALWDLPG